MPITPVLRLPGAAFRALTAAAILAGMVPAIDARVRAEVPAAREADARDIHAAAKRYMTALEAGDAAALATLWAPEADIIDDVGNVLPARETVTAPGGEGPRPMIRLAETNLRFVCADAAIEDGTVEVTLPGGSLPIKGRFSATWVRHDGAWKLAALREARVPAPEGPAALQELDWMVGDWTAEDIGGDAKPTSPRRTPVRVSTRWNESRTFLVREVEVLAPDADGRPVAMTISQRIGWDPLAREIHSWAFGSDGSVSEASWSRDGASWVARTQTVRPGGGQTSSINIYSHDGADRCQWRSLPTHIGGEHLPQISLTMIRSRREVER